MGITVGAVVALVLAFFAYNTYVVAPKTAEAGTEMAQAIKWFEADSMDLALNGNGANYGFLDIMDEYGSTPAGNGAHYYRPRLLCYWRFRKCYRNTRQLQRFEHCTGAMALGVIGDAFAELGQMDDAADYYQKAAKSTDNAFTTPLFLESRSCSRSKR